MTHVTINEEVLSDGSRVRNLHLTQDEKQLVFHLKAPTMAEAIDVAHDLAQLLTSVTVDDIREG